MKKSSKKISKKTSKRKTSTLKSQREKESLRDELLKIKARQELIKKENKSDTEELLKSFRNLRSLDFVYLHAGVDSPLSRQIEKFRMNPMYPPGHRDFTKIGDNAIRCNRCDRTGNCISGIIHSPKCPKYDPNINETLQNMSDDEYSRLRNPKLRNRDCIRKNPGGGWIFEGKFANKWDAFRSLEKSLFGKFNAQVRDRKDHSWWDVIVFRDFQSVGLTPAGASKFSNIIKIINLQSEYRKVPEFTGKDKNDWTDWRIGYDSGGVELLDKKGTWWSVNVWIRNEVIGVIDVRYPVDKDI